MTVMTTRMKAMTMTMAMTTITMTIIKRQQ